MISSLGCIYIYMQDWTPVGLHEYSCNISEISHRNTKATREGRMNNRSYINSSLQDTSCLVSFADISGSRWFKMVEIDDDGGFRVVHERK